MLLLLINYLIPCVLFHSFNGIKGCVRTFDWYCTVCNCNIIICGHQDYEKHLHTAWCMYKCAELNRNVRQSIYNKYHNLTTTFAWNLIAVTELIVYYKKPLWLSMNH